MTSVGAALVRCSFDTVAAPAAGANTAATAHAVTTPWISRLVAARVGPRTSIAPDSLFAFGTARIANVAARGAEPKQVRGLTQTVCGYPHLRLRTQAATFIPPSREGGRT